MLFKQREQDKRHDYFMAIPLIFCALNSHHPFYQWLQPVGHPSKNGNRADVATNIVQTALQLPALCRLCWNLRKKIRNEQSDRVHIECIVNGQGLKCFRLRQAFWFIAQFGVGPAMVCPVYARFGRHFRNQHQVLKLSKQQVYTLPCPLVSPVPDVGSLRQQPESQANAEPLQQGARNSLGLESTGRYGHANTNSPAGLLGGCSGTVQPSIARGY